MKISYINLCGKDYPLVFSLAATEKICEEFGDLDGMQKALDSDNMVKKLSATDRVLSILMDAGHVYCSAMGIEVPEKLPCRPADVLDISDPSAISSIFKAIASDTKRDVETQSKNVVPTQES